MISYIRGTLISKREDSIIVECHHIGYEIFVPLSVLGELPPTGNEVKIHTEHYVREDMIKLFGFITEDDIDVFRKLISVSGIGPKGALGILSTMTPDALRLAVLTENVTAISQAKGIGKKTAQKLVLELKDKLKPIDLDTIADSGTVIETTSSFVQEAMMALTALGYSQTESLNAVKHSSQHDSTEQIIKEALSFLAKE